LGISVLAIFKSVGDYRDLEKIAGGAAGGIASFLTGFVPVKEVLARLDRLRILRAVEARLAVPTEAPEEYVKLVWKMYEKAAAG
jgi:hypothetical protein